MPTQTELTPADAAAAPVHPVVCHCLGITRTEIIAAVRSGQAESIRDLRLCTGAGAGCTACHFQLRAILQRHGLS